MLDRDYPQFVNTPPLVFQGTYSMPDVRGPRAYKVQYEPISKARPEGLGLWPTSNSVIREYFPPSPGDWLKQPQVGEALVVKIRRGTETEVRNIDLERAIMLRNDSLFRPDALHRPARLVGYGHQFLDDFSYLLIERIPDNYSPLAFHLTRGEALPLDEVLDLGIGVTGILSTVHSAGIAHHDLESAGAHEHILWDPNLRSARIIDWNISYDNQFPLEVDKFRASRRIDDLNGVAKVMIEGLLGDITATGGESNLNDYRFRLLQLYPRPLVETLVAIIDKGLGLYTLKYRKASSMHNDLTKLKASL